MSNKNFHNTLLEYNIALCKTQITLVYVYFKQGSTPLFVQYSWFIRIRIGQTMYMTTDKQN